MSHQPLQRGPITKAVLAAARSTDFPAEVALIPKDGGWRDGAPAGDRSLFTPYTVVVPQTASFTTGALDYGQDDWHLPYAFNYYAIMVWLPTFMVGERQTRPRHSNSVFAAI